MKIPFVSSLLGGWALYAVIGVAALGVGAYGGYRFESGALQSYKAQVAGNALRAEQRYAAQLRQQQNLYNMDVAAQAEATAKWQAQASAAQASVSRFQQEIGHADFGVKPVAARNGVCPGDPFGSPVFIELFDRASGAVGVVSKPVAHSGGVLVVGAG